MEQIIITRTDGTKLPLISKRAVSSVTKAEQRVALLGDDIIEITVSSATPIEFALGDTIEVYGKTYTLNVLPSIKKTGTRKYAYDLTFEGPQYDLIDVQFLLPEETTTGDSLTADLAGFLRVFIENVLRVFPGKWALGVFPLETEYKTLIFNGENCLSVLQNFCAEFSQEFEITQSNGVRILNIRTAGTTFPYTFRYGKTGGLYELTRQNINSKNAVTRLYIYGGSSNLGSKYRHSKLCLPGKSKNGSYIENAAAIAAFGLKENTKVFDKIFPNRYGEVSAKGAKYYAFVDNTMNFDLNEKEEDGKTTKWLINGVNAKVHFNTGNLAGYEFEIHKYDHATKTIELVPFTDENGMKFPSETSAAFQFAPGDKYFFIDINLPDAYKIEAEGELMEEGDAYYAQNCQPQVQYGLTIDQNFIKQFAGNLTVVNLFAVGDYIPVEDEDLGLAKSIRVLGYTRDLLQPYKYSLTLGDSVTKSAYTRIISEIRTIDKIVEINNLADPSNARRNWRATQEVLAMVFDPDGDYYSEKIKPLSVETTMLATGAKSMQFVLRDVVFEPNYEGNPNYIKVSGGTLVHYTIEDAIRSWTIATVTYSNLVNSTPYYIYARCSKTTGAGSIILDTAQRKVDYETGYYTFTVGVLNSVETDAGGKNPARLVALTYGSSTIAGRFIKTGRIESSGGGSTYFDLDNGEIGGKIKFIASDGSTKNVSDVDSVAQESKDYLNNTLPGILDELQAQLDGQIEQFFETYDPTTNNAPANTWTTTAKKEEHLGDLFYNTDTGKVYRWVKNGSTYFWQELQDSEIAQALALANDALALAQSKRRIFTATPYPPYDVGDLWVQGSGGDIMRCKTARTTGNYAAADWDKASGYDNTKTIIDGGIVTSGTVQLAGSGGSILAGITGDGTAASSVRMWAGASKDNRASAPFRVMQDGSFVATNAKITGEINATLGTFRNVTIYGTIRSPFVQVQDSFGTGYSDNAVMLGGGSWTAAYSLPWDVAQSGRRITLINYRWGSTIGTGYSAINAPSGKYFFEDGISKNELQFSREVIELLGYGDSSTFFGWIITNRHNIMTEGKYGRQLRVLGQGTVTCASTSSASINYKTFDGGTMSVSRTGKGVYNVYMPWSLDVGSYIVMLTGKWSTLENTPIYATIKGQYASYFTIQTQDDASANDGSFNFQIINLNDWS